MHVITPVLVHKLCTVWAHNESRHIDSHCQSGQNYITEIEDRLCLKYIKKTYCHAQNAGTLCTKCTNVMLKMHPQIAKTLCTKNPGLWYLHMVLSC